MQIFDFINQDELDELPEDENAAFLEFVRIARRRLQERLNQLNGNDESDWHVIEEARHGFMNVVIASARRFRVEPFATMDVPQIKNFSQNEYQQFVADLDHYMTQLLLDSRIAKRQETVGLSAAAKENIRTRLHHLREALERSECDERTRARLRARLDEFEKDLDKSRINILAVARVAIEILAVPGALAGSYDVSVKMINQIMQTIGKERIDEDERRRLPPVEKPAALIPPRAEEKKKLDADFGRGFSRDLDDEIPF